MKAGLYAIIVIILLVVIGGGIYLANRPTTTTTTTTSSTPTPTATLQASTTATPLVTQTLNTPSTPAAQSTTSITVTGKEYSFTPKKITVSKGNIVKLTFTNSGTMEHNLVIPSLNLSTKTISPGQSDTIQFTANQTGTFDYYCSISNHKALGMTGTLTVQ